MKQGLESFSGKLIHVDLFHIGTLQEFISRFGQAADITLNE